MGIRLDWDVDSDRTERHDVVEDPQSVRERRQNLLKLVMFVTGFALVIGGAAGALLWQLREADRRIENLLRDTVEAEVAAIRIGDLNAFMSLQRSATDDWLRQQRLYFETYQNIKVTNDLNFSGTIRGIEIDNTRARVLVEEIIDGVPFTQVWFYWFYGNVDESGNRGWRHVPPDYTFWGRAQEYQGRAVTVTYREVDERLALDLSVKAEGWIDGTCGVILQCGDLPHITINIVPDTGLDRPRWSEERRWQLNVPSPHLVRARWDRPFSGQLRVDVANAIATRLVEEASSMTDAPNYPADAYYLRPAVVSWLTGLFAEVNTNAHIIISLAENYGRAQVGELLVRLQPDDSADVLRRLTGVSRLDEANLDWRDFLTWRLLAEDELRQRGNLERFRLMYTPEAAELATRRFSGAEPYRAQGIVILAEKGLGVDGVPQIVATVRYGEDNTAPTERVLFRLSGDTWRRAN